MSRFHQNQRGYNNDRRGGGYNSQYRQGGNYNGGYHGSQNYGSFQGRSDGNRDDNNRGDNNRGRNNQPWQGRGGGGGSNAPKKLPGNMMPRKEEPQHASVALAQTLITRLGNFSAFEPEEDLYSNIKAMSNALMGGGDLKTMPDEISALFVKCMSQLSVQGPIISSLVALLHVEESQFTAILADKLQAKLLQATADDDVATTKLLLRCVACLTASGVFEIEGPGGMAQILNFLLEPLSAELGAAHNADNSLPLQLSAHTQASAYLLASTLVWAAPALHSSVDSASSLLTAAHSALELVVSRWCSSYSVGGLQAVMGAYAAPESDADMETESADPASRVLSVGPSARNTPVLADGSAWDSLWEAATQACAVLETLQSSTASYQYPSYMNAYWVNLQAEDLLAGVTTKLSFSQRYHEEWISHARGLGSRATHCIATGAMTSVIGSAASSTWLRMRMTIFDTDTSEDCAHCCALSAHAKYQAKAYFEDILNFFDPVINEDGTKLGSMELLTTHLIAVFKMFPTDAHTEYILIETLMQILLQQPVNPTLSASVFRLMLELCRRDPRTFPPVVALGTNTVFQMVPDLDVGAALEFGRWFSFHLINTQLSWPQHYWEFWVTEMQDAEAAGQRAVPLFLRFIVERLSYAVIPDKLKAALPEALHTLIPPNDPANCPLMTEECAGSMLSRFSGVSSLAQQLKTQIEAKADPDDVTDWLEAQVLSGDGAEDVCWRGCLLLQVLVHVAVSGNDSALSAVVGLLDRYSDGLLTHATTERDHSDLLNMLGELYGSNHYMYHYLLDEMMRRGQISVNAAANALCTTDSAGMARWVVDPFSQQCIGSVLDRAVDFVKAAVALRSQLGGDFSLDENADLTPAAAPEEVAAGSSAVKKRAIRDDDADMAAEGSDNEEDDERRKRSRRGEDEDAAADAMEGDNSMMQEQDEDPLWAAEESLKTALRNCRAVYGTITASCRQVITSAADSPDAGYMAASLLRRTLRLFHGTERLVSHQHARRAVLSASSAQFGALMHQLAGSVAVEVGISSARWNKQIQSDAGR